MRSCRYAAGRPKRRAREQKRESKDEAGKAHLTSPVTGIMNRVGRELIAGRRFGGSACQAQNGFVGTADCFVGTGATKQSSPPNGHARVTGA